MLFGNAGRDRFIFTDRWGNDTIGDFQDGVDMIHMARVSGFSDFSQLTVTAAANGTLISLAGHTILLEGVSADLLDAGDFIL